MKGFVEHKYGWKSRCIFRRAVITMSKKIDTGKIRGWLEAKPFTVLSLGTSHWWALQRPQLGLHTAVVWLGLIHKACVSCDGLKPPSLSSESCEFSLLSGGTLEDLHRCADVSEESTYSLSRNGNKFAWLPMSFVNNVLSAVQGEEQLLLSIHI